MVRMYTIDKTSEFSDWLSALRDLRARARIVSRIKSAEHGNFGDCEPVGEGVSEMRIHVGAGYRVYFTQREKVVYLLLCGGDKSTQKRDIARAKAIRKQLEEE
jgi:putative addiction module killer protein